MIKQLNKNSVHEHLLQRERLLESKNKQKLNSPASVTGNGIFLTKVCLCILLNFIYLCFYYFVYPYP